MNKRGNPKHSGHGTLTYARWKSMMQRCYTTTATNYRHYGAKGVKVCERWHDFANFHADMGDCPSADMTLDRTDNSKGYEPGNCRWITQAEQNRNRSYCIELTHNGQTKILRDWAVEVGLTPNTLAQRIRLGWTVERALTQPLKARTTKTFRTHAQGEHRS